MPIDWKELLYKLGLEEVKDENKSIKELASEVIMTDDKLQKSVNDYVENMVKQGLVEEIQNKILEKIDMYNELGVTNEVEKVKEYETIYMDDMPVQIYKGDIDKNVLRQELSERGVKYRSKSPSLKNIDLTIVRVKTKLSDIIEEKGMKYTWIAEKTGINRVTLYNITENPNSISLLNAYKLSSLLGIKIDDLFSFEEIEK